MIEEARRRQRGRRNRRTAVAALVAAALVGGMVWALAGASSAGSAHVTSAYGHSAVGVQRGDPSALTVRLWPDLERVGQAGWCSVAEEHGRVGGSSCEGVALASDPIVAASGSGVGGSHRWTTIMVTTPEVAAILVDGKTRVADGTRSGAFRTGSGSRGS